MGKRNHRSQVRRDAKAKVKSEFSQKDSHREQVEQLKAELEQLKETDRLGYSQKTMNDMIAQRDAKHIDYVDEKYKVEQLKAELEPLKEFARYVITTECWGSYEGLDGCSIQDLAVKLGLIEPHIATAEDVDEESIYEVGDKIYKYSKVLKGSRNVR